MILVNILLILLLSGHGICIRIATYNLWNIMFNWEVRKLRISQLIKEADPDIIGLQEVRSDKLNEHNQISELQQLLPQYAWHVYHPVQSIQFMKGTYKTSWSQEGLGIMSKHPLVSSHVQHLTYHSGPDGNRRIVLHASFLLDGKEVSVSLLHMSYDRRQQCRNVLELSEFIKGPQGKDSILMGDFNTYNNYEDPIQALTGQPSQCLNSPTGLELVDAWPNLYEADKGYTFSNMPAPGLESRPDRILFPRQRYKAISALLLGDGSIYRQRYGYHITWARLGDVISTAMDGWRRGETGRSCAYDCGPHGSCRCGVCVAGVGSAVVVENGDNGHNNRGDQKACKLPDCEECTGSLIILLAASIIFSVILTFSLIYAMLRVMHAMNRRGFANSGPNPLCCLLNPLLYTQIDTNRTRLCCFSRLPPMLMVICCVLLILFVAQLLLYCFKDVLDDVSAVLPEEYFPSDHRMLVVEIESL